MQKAKVKPRCHTVSQVFTPLAQEEKKTAIAKADAAKKAAEDEASAEAAKAAMGRRSVCSDLWDSRPFWFAGGE